MMQRSKMIVAMGLVGFSWLAWQNYAAPQAAMVVPPAAALMALSAETPQLAPDAAEDAGACKDERGQARQANPMPAPPPIAPQPAPQHAPPAHALSARGAVLTRRPLTWPKLLSPPTVERLRAERRRQPQATPPSYLRYAAHWAQCVQSVGSDSTRAYDVFAHAEACVERAPAPPPEVQALCLRHAQQMAADFSELTPRYHRLRAHADRRVLALVDAPTR